MKKKIVAVIDYQQQCTENNIYWGDFPMKNALTGRKLKKYMGYYYRSWEEYYDARNLDGLDEYIEKGEAEEARGL